MLRKSCLGLCLVFLLLISPLPPAGSSAIAGPPSPLEQLSAPLQPVTGGDGPVISGEIGAMATAILYPSDDAPVRYGAPSTTAPGQFYLGAGYDDGSLYGSPAGAIRSYLRFDLSSISADSNIVTASLRVYHAASRDYPGTTRTVTFYRVTESWNEATVAWNNRPGYAEAVGGVSMTHGHWEWKILDVTNQVRAWVSGSQANYGLVAIMAEDPQGIYRAFASRETINSPELDIHYVPAPPPVLDLAPGNLSVSASSPQQGTVQISDVTAGSLSWTATKVGSIPWLSLSKTSGSATPTTPDTLGLTADPSGLSPGSYTGQVYVSSSTPRVRNSPLTVTLTLRVVSQVKQVYLPVVLKGGGRQ